MILRVLLAALFLAFAILVLRYSYYIEDHGSLGHFIANFLINFSAGLAGISIVVGVIELIFERKERNEKSKNTAALFLVELSEVFWIWLGGKKDLDLDELVSKIYYLQHDLPLAKTTRLKFRDLSAEAKKKLILEHQLLDKNEKLAQAVTLIKDMPLITHKKACEDEEAQYCHLYHEQFEENKIELCYIIIELTEIANLPKNISATLHDKLSNSMNRAHSKMHHNESYTVSSLDKVVLDAELKSQKKRYFGQE